MPQAWPIIGHMPMHDSQNKTAKPRHSGVLRAPAPAAGETRGSDEEIHGAIGQHTDTDPGCGARLTFPRSGPRGLARLPG